MYTEIDDTFLASNKLINGKSINGENFWSVRKIECIKNEFEVSDEPFIYMDTDIIMNQPFQLDNTVDLLVWSPETQEKIYIPWTHLSVPKGYVMPRYIYETEGAYNCGVLYFKDKKIFSEYRKQYLAYTINNPCETSGVSAAPSVIHNIWACNAEQRILKAISNACNLNVNYIMPEQGIGACAAGIHYYCFRGCWRLLALDNELTEDSRIS